MKINKYIALLLLAFTLILGCERRHLEDNLLESTVYFSRGGLQEVLFYDIEGTFDYNFYAVNAGYFRGTTEVSVDKDVSGLDKYNKDNETNLKELPSDCYSITKNKGMITEKEDATQFTIQFICEKLQALSQKSDYSDLKEYVVPLLLSTDGGIKASNELNMLFLNPSMKKMAVSAVSPGEVTVTKSEISGTLTFEFPVKTMIENQWETTFRILTGDEAVNKLNSTLLSRGTLEAYSALMATPSDAYSVEFEDMAKPGTSTIVMTVDIDASKVPDGCSSIVLWLDGATVLGQETAVEGVPYLIIHLQNVMQVSTAGIISITDVNSDSNYLGKYLEKYGYNALPLTGWTFSPESYHGSTNKNVLDGKTNTIWENRYNDTAGSVGPKSSLPFNVIIDLSGPQTFSAIELWRRSHATYVSDLRGFEIYVSDDNQAWRYVTTVDYGTTRDQRAMYNFFPEVTARYVNLYMTKSNRSNAVSIAELYLWNN